MIRGREEEATQGMERPQEGRPEDRRQSGEKNGESAEGETRIGRAWAVAAARPQEEKAVRNHPDSHIVGDRR